MLTTGKTERQAKSFDVGVKDDTLLEVLSSRKTKLTITQGKIKPSKNEKAQHKTDDNTLTYVEANKRGQEMAKENVDRKKKKEIRQRVKLLVGKRFLEPVAAILLIVLIGLFVMVLLFPQTEISELARDNSNLKDQINTTKREIVKAEENANGIADMDAIRAQALALGMQDPNQNQVINLPLPNTDSLKTRMTYNYDGISDDAFKDSKDSLAEYYAAHPDK